MNAARQPAGKANDPRLIEHLRRREAKRAEEAAADLREVLSTEGGRRFVWRLLGDSGIFRTSFTGNSETFFREGERNVGLKVFNAIHQVCPDLYLVMQREAAERAERDAAEDRSVTKD
ncbi:MAG TPA: hypothetical protein VK001_02955 [Geminicoccaceae bacterium]|nr:hypothetical protein [Geminicoccaceae bacterium]